MTTVRQRRRAATAVATALLLGLGVAGCGSGSGAEADSASDGDSQEERQDELMEYAECMRENGVPEYPDPVDGRIQLQAQPGSSLDPESQAFKDAEEACKELEPPGLGESGESSGQEEQLLEYSECMRDNGITNFPDPVDGRLTLTPDSGIDLDSQEFKDAEEACRNVMDGSAPGGA